MSQRIANNLNDRQNEAVTSESANTLVIAGAGSGKTKVLIHRIAYILEQGKATPMNILAVTFTNKAANEMKARVEHILEFNSAGMWIGTFHGLCHRMLRQHFEAAGLPENFQILDQDDQAKLIKKIHGSMNLDETQWPPKKSQHYINNHKENGVTSAAVITGNNPQERTLLSVYQNYEKQCQISGLIDFADLLLKTVEMLKRDADLRQSYQQRFRYILVDEFQDINNIQYMWLKIMSAIYDNPSKTNNVMVVGDDDQSIYSWRGAKIEHILSFSKEYPDVRTVRLEQNYRSSGNILAAANAVIEKNDGRLGKSLWTDGGAGSPIYMYHSMNELDEATFIAKQIQAWQNNGGKLSDVAILYRSNAQSRVMEEIFNRFQIPYQIYGGLRFFDRAEIKDALCYMRIVANQNDNAAFERVINQPARGIGKQTLTQLREHANSAQISLFAAAQTLISTSSLSTRATAAVQGFITLIQDMQAAIANKTVGESATLIIEKSQLVAFYRQDKKEQSQTKIENLEELLNAAELYQNPDNDNTPTLCEFLAHSTLASENRDDNQDNNRVHLMTLHAAKGLEYNLVFLSGLEEGLFPHKMSILEENRLNEERRLCYVGITRAREKLCITHAATRRLHGSETYQSPSRFLSEIPPELVQEIKTQHSPSPKRSYGSSRSSNNYQRSDYTQRQDREYSKPKPTPIKDDSSQNNSYRLGQKVRHAKFGHGTVLNYEGDKDNGRVQIKFRDHGVKWLVTSYAKIDTID